MGTPWALPGAERARVRLVRSAFWRMRLRRGIGTMARVIDLGTILTDRVIVAATVVCLAGAGLVGWKLFTPDRPSTLDAKPKVRTYTHVRCPECGDQMAYAQELVGTPCTACDEGAVYAPVVGSGSMIRFSSMWGKAAVFT